MMSISLLEMGFMQPQRLWALVLVPILLMIYLLWNLMRRSKASRDRSSLELLFPKRKAWKRHVAVVAAIASLATLTVAWAMPNGFVNVPKDRATVFLVVDVSLSMEAEDVYPNRLIAAQRAINEFVDELPSGFNLSLISFAATAITLVRPTTNKDDVKHAVDNLQLRQSTAIGEGIYAALDGVVMIPPDPNHPNELAPVVIVLISDGESNSGRDSAVAAEDAKKMQIPVFTIAYGTPEGFIIDRGQRNQVPVNTEELRRIAQISGGKAYTADSSDRLREVYAGISRSVGYEREEQEITEKFVGYAGILGLISLLGVMSLAARWP
ncbi:MAG: VWA domain-containing protein [Propionibacteriaceae bacterium]|jgi:Ca-activated chloride channel family protein|nr:VWA domain-containing protein [Propionibacteriaceae bacterium]